MFTHICDRCGQPMEKNQLRYVAKIQVFAAADTLEITAEDLLKDPGDEIARLMRQCEDMTEEELMRDVFVELQFDLCRPCQRAYLANPLGEP
jgi:hypothetical protein